MSKSIELVCICGKTFSRPLKEHTRSLNLRRKEFCSRKCAGNAVADNLGKFKGNGNISNFGDKRNLYGRKDEFTGYRYFVRKALERKPESTITVEEVKEKWIAQDGKCAYTGIPLILKFDGKYYLKKNRKQYQQASLDRIDSSKPYNKDNIQFVSLSINLMKHEMTDADTKELVALIKKTI